MDSSYCDHSLFRITNYDNWKEFYPDTIEELPHNMPTPFGKKAQITVYVNADHAHDTITLRSVTAIILFKTKQLKD
jgi:hypothetical protein